MEAIRELIPSLLDETGITAQVLVVDDDPLVRNVAAATLEHFNFEVVLAENGEQALELFKRHNDSIDLLIVDIVMPGGNGMLVSAMILHERPDLPVLYISGYSPETLRNFGIDATSKMFISKPFTPREMMQKVYAALVENGTNSQDDIDG
jgi:two-component system cell cycle sensor histidine kinase/response regulator CckA